MKVAVRYLLLLIGFGPFPMSQIKTATEVKKIDGEP